MFSVRLNKTFSHLMNIMYANEWIRPDLNCINQPLSPTVAKLKWRKNVLQANEVRGGSLRNKNWGINKHKYEIV